MAKTIIQSGRLDYECKTVPIDSVDVWDEANVRHTELTVDLEELAESIRQIGLLQPPLVQEIEPGKYKLIEGQRRLLAVRKLGWKTIAVLILKEPYDLLRAKLASVSENLHRKKITPSDLANACDYLKDHYPSEKEAARALGISLLTFKKYLGYKGVPDELKRLVGKKGLSVSDANRLFQIVPEVSKAVKFAKMIQGLPKPARERYFVALLEDPSDSLLSIKSRAERSKYKTIIKIHLPETYANALYRISGDSQLEPEAIAQKAVMEWLDGSGYVK